MSAPTTDQDGIRQTVRALLDAGYTLDSVDNGEDEEPVETEDQAVEHCTETDDSTLWVKGPDGKLHMVYFVLGNDPDEVVCDYHVTLEPVIGPLCDRWNN